MGFRVDREAFDPGGAAYSGAQIYQTSETMVPWQPRPFSTKEEYAVSNALRLMSIPADQIRAIRPPMINELFPPTEGYNNVQLRIEDVLDTNRWGPQLRSWTSGAAAPRRSTSNDAMWSGTSRNATDPSMNPAG